MTNYKKGLDFFKFTIEDLKQIIHTALSKGGDYADIYIEDSQSHELALKDGEVNAQGAHIDYGIGIRVLNGDQTGYAYSETPDIKDILKAASVAAQISNESNSKTTYPVNITPISTPSKYLVADSWIDKEIEEKIPILKEINDLLFSSDSKIVKVIARLSDSFSKILFFNSNGEVFYDERPMVSLVISCIMQEGSKTENWSVSRSFRKDFSFITKELIEEMCNEAVQKCSIQFQASQPKGGQMAVVMGAGSSGILLHEAIGHAFEADFNRKDISIFSDKLGKKICNESINIIDDATLMYNRGSVNVDDEGVVGQKTYMVKDGILNSYLHDRISAKYYNTQSTGNGRRESFRYAPIPRMRATYMESGTAKEEDLIKSVTKGIFVDSFSNGQVQIGAGDFTFFVKSGYLIENGKLTTPIKDINIIGDGPEALADIVAVADNCTIDNGTWICGKEQYAPVSCGMPSILIKQLTVGGNN